LYKLDAQRALRQDAKRAATAIGKKLCAVHLIIKRDHACWHVLLQPFQPLQVEGDLVGEIRSPRLRHVFPAYAIDRPHED
jgi:hypothetical protein